MRHESKKIAKLIDELTTMFLNSDTNMVEFSVEILEEKSIIKLVDYNTNITEERADYLNTAFNKPRQPAIEEYYWQIMGSHDTEDEVTLLSMMTDAASVERRDGNLYIELIRYLQ